MQENRKENNDQKYASKVEFLRDRIDDRINSYQKRRKDNRTRSFRLKILGTSFSALTTILLGLQGIGSTASLVVKDVALILSAMVTVIGAWESFFDHRGLWIRYTKAALLLKGLLADLDYAIAGSDEAPSKEQLDELFQRYQAILAETNSSWLQLREDNSRSGAART